MAANANPMQQSLLRMADEDPQLAARMLITALPAAAAGVRGPLDYELVVEELGAYRVSIGNGAATVTSAEAESINGNPEFVLRTDARALARLAAGASPLRLMLGGRLHVQGKRRRALKLRRLTAGLTMREIARAGVEPDPDLVYQALPYAIDPAWTKGHRFCQVRAARRRDRRGGRLVRER